MEYMYTGNRREEKGTLQTFGNPQPVTNKANNYYQVYGLRTCWGHYLEAILLGGTESPQNHRSLLYACVCTVIYDNMCVHACMCVNADSRVFVCF